MRGVSGEYIEQPFVRIGCTCSKYRQEPTPCNLLRKSSGMEPSLLELIRLRSSQIDGCAYCIDMHTKDARASGETEQRLYAVSIWRETPFFTERACGAVVDRADYAHQSGVRS
jgi:AhpD family alkylhydroperoxidase